MNACKRAIAGAGLLLLAVTLWLDNTREALQKAFGVKQEPLEHGRFRLTGIAPNQSAKRAMWGAALFACGIALFIGALAVNGPGIAHLLAYMTLAFGAAGSFSLSAPANTPLPQYTLLGVYTGGSSDTSPLNIPFATYNATFAARCNGVAPIPTNYVVQTLGNVTAMGFTCTATNLVLTFTSSGSGLLGFVATLGAEIPNTISQP